MSRISLLEDDQLSPQVRERVRKVEASGADVSVLRAVAHRQDMFEQYFTFYYPWHQGGVVEPELKELVRLKIARLNDCFTGLNARFPSTMEKGLTEEKISALDGDGNAFSSREKLALAYAEKLAVDHHSIDDAFFEQLRGEFSEPEVLELGMMIGQYIGFGRLLKVLDLEPRYCPTDG